MNVGASLRALQKDRVIANVDIARALGLIDRSRLRSG